LKHSEKVLGVTLIFNHQTAEVLQPGKQLIDFPPSPVSFQPTSILVQRLAGEAWRVYFP
jgi:hypothetical protein